MIQKNFATCRFFESEDCPNVYSGTMQRVFSPGSAFKGTFKNIADVENIQHAIDMCAHCSVFEPTARQPQKPLHHPQVVSQTPDAAFSF